MGVIFMKAWMTDDQARLNRWRVVWRLEIQDAATARPQTCFLDTRNCSGSPVEALEAPGGVWLAKGVRVEATRRSRFCTSSNQPVVTQ